MVAVFSCSPALYCGHGKKQRPKRGAKGEVYGKSCGRSDPLLPQAGGPDAGAAGRGDGRLRCGGEQVGAGSFPNKRILETIHETPACVKGITIEYYIF